MDAKNAAGSVVLVFAVSGSRYSTIYYFQYALSRLYKRRASYTRYIQTLRHNRITLT